MSRRDAELEQLLNDLRSRVDEWGRVAQELLTAGYDVAASQVESCRSEIADLIHGEF